MSIHDIDNETDFDFKLQKIVCNNFTNIVDHFLTEDRYNLKEIFDVHEKLNLIEEIFEKNNFFGSLDVLKESSKNDKKSNQYRIKGNDYYSKNCKSEALNCYNFSIMYANADSINIFLGYANRSAVLFKIGRYSDCLNSIKLAKSCSQIKFPPKIIEKINIREKKCLRNMSTKEEVEDETFEFNLSYPKHEKCPYIINCLEIKKSIGTNNFFYTTHDLKVGDVISIEPVFCSSIISYENYSSSCANCLTENVFSLIPCANCVYATYCSVECRSKDWNSCHKYLCVIQSRLIECPSSTILALKASLKGITIFENISELNSYCKNKKIFNDSVFQEKDYYKIFYNIVNRKKTDNNNLKFLIYLVLINRYLFKFTELKFTNKEEEKLFINLMIHNYKDNVVPLQLRDKVIKEDNCVVAPITELFNHSCSPNVERVSDNMNITTIAIRPIKANESLNICYGGSRFYEIDKKIRQKFLKDNYNIICKCEACTKNYGLGSSYTSRLSLPPIFKPYEIPHLMSSKVIYSKLIAYSQRNGSHYPCHQLIKVDEMLKDFFAHGLHEM